MTNTNREDEMDQALPLATMDTLPTVPGQADHSTVGQALKWLW